ncbi:type II toxin-antitoxin system RelB family antitoxin [Parasphaerochaeta coccoides]|uniref:CopG family transcriptional regulator n=1 Tax=Parasphaerochaeta coccoides (strain ATCC BAA-1237 / DSM 17374 / SPN1) TaxID=760011 RepID=F4GJZ9_PARC1|nr:DUF6290 family protein [Parasphaerochaeta coccoides]AEC01424.1 hypothetical protein Spico_0186 [Parasphaerochaeta coccoides DSM 17374]
MPHVSFRVSEQEKIWLDSYAKVKGQSLSNAVRNAIFDRLEDEYDLKTLQEFETARKNGTAKLYSLDEVGKILGFK